MCSVRKTENQGEVLPPKVALLKCRDKTNFDGQADNCLARGKHRHRKRREKPAGKETTPMKRNDADDEGVQWRNRCSIPRQQAKRKIDDCKAEDRGNIGNHGAAWLVPIPGQHVKKARKEV